MTYREFAQAYCDATEQHYKSTGQLHSHDFILISYEDFYEIVTDLRAQYDFEHKVDDKVLGPDEPPRYKDVPVYRVREKNVLKFIFK